MTNGSTQLMETKLIEVTTTCDCQERAQELARQLISERLAACVQISGPIESVYRWRGKVETSQEWACTAKSLGRLQEKIVEFITRHHSYEVPQILVLPVLAASASYAAWVEQEVGA